MKTNKIISPLPVVFICAVLIIAVLNMNSFKTIYQIKIIDAKPTNKQTALASIESEYTSSFAGSTNYIDINGLFSIMVDKVELNERHKLNNGYFTDTIVGYDDSSWGINNITNLKKYLDLYEIPFAYVQTPHVIPTDDDEMIPFGYETHINGNSDRLLEGLEENGISYLDLRENFKEDGLNHYDYFYSTDHHWNTMASFISSKYIIDFIDNESMENLAFDEYFDINNFQVEVFKDELLGSHGTRTGIYYAGIDDVIAIKPLGETKFTVETPSSSSKITGDFEKALMDYSIFDTRVTDKFWQFKYRVYPFHSDYTKITNHNATNEKKILVLRDSFLGSLAPFLALQYKEVHLYDVRSGDKEEGFIQVLHEVQPDLVLQVRITSDVLTADAKKEIQ